MELLLIPALAGLGLYTINTQNTATKKEGFRVLNDELPNTDLKDSNYPSQYPIDNIRSDETITSKLSTVNAYNGGPTYTDKYFLEDTFNNPVLANGQPIFKSLTGLQSSDYFKHNNMVPFFGAKLRDIHTANNVNESLLDNMVGQGSQTIVKKEVSPFFSAQQDLGWANGTPNTAEFVRSRINASKKMSNVSPFESVKVAPGLGLGAGEDGLGGFNSGMLARNQWIDKSVDELRVATKPKASGLSQLGYEGAPSTIVKNQGEIGLFEKHGPDTTFPLGFERSVGALSATKGNSQYPDVIERYTSRPETNAPNYTGVASPSGGNVGQQLQDGEYMPSNRMELGELPLGSADGTRTYKYTNDADFGIKSTIAYPNNRTANYEEDYFGVASNTIQSILAPLMDVLKTTRKENAVGTLRPYQNPASKVPNSYIYNPNDKTPTTIREMTENPEVNNRWMVNASAYQSGQGYISGIQGAQNSIKHNQRDYTEARSSYVGASSASEGTRGPRTYEAEYNQRNNDLKSSTLRGYAPAGNMSIFQNQVNVFSSPQRENSASQTSYHSSPMLGTNSPNMEIIGRMMGGNNLYTGIELDRNQSNIMGDILKSNPYAITSLSQL